MVHRLALISNIGSFDQVASGAQLPISKFTIVYAENGRGKTTHFGHPALPLYR